MKKIGRLDLNSQQRLIIYDTDFESPTLQAAMGAGGGNIPLIIDKAIRLGNIYGTEKQGGFAGNVWDKECLCPTLKTCSGGQSQPLIVAMRGRNPENPSDRTPGIKTEQRLEPNTNGTANTITSVQKDNLVIERDTSLTEVRMGGNKSTIIIDDLYKSRDERVYEEYAPTLRSNCSGLKKIEINTISTKGKKIDIASTILAGYERSNMTGFNADNCVIEKKEIPTIKIRQATKQGYVECEVGGIADLSYPTSKTRRGRVQSMGNISPTLQAGENDLCKVTEYRIRKLTPKECWRLMGFSDEDFEKAEKVNSNTQLYKQAGNSIVVDVLVEIFRNLFIETENIPLKGQMKLEDLMQKEGNEID